MSAIQDKDILILTHLYASFIKDQVEVIANSYKHIDVLVRRNRIADISNILPINYLKPFSSAAVMDVAHKPDNVQVYETPVLYAPTVRGYKNLSKKHYYSAEKVVTANKLHFDFMHAHIIVSAGYAGAMLKEKYGVPLVVTAHGIDIYDTPFRDDEWRQQTEYVLNTADQIITVSEKNNSCIKRLNVKTPVTVIPNGYRKDLFHPMSMKECRSKLGLPQDKKIIVTVGKLFKIKGHTYLIDAMGEIIKNRKDVLCVIVGDGELRQTLEKQIKSKGLEPYIMITGGRPHSEIPMWINAGDIFVLPSLNEGNPTVMFECLGCGKPFIGSSVGGVPEVITSDELGYLVQPADVKALADKLSLALGRSWDGERIYEYASAFTWEKIAEDIIQVYKKLPG